MAQPAQPQDMETQKEGTPVHRGRMDSLGEVNLTLVNVLRLATALGVDAGQLVKGMAQRLGDPRTV